MYPARNQRVMVVDDEEGVRLSWNRYLSDKGFDVTTVEDGTTAISRLSEKPVDVVVSDLRMPGLDGLQLLQWIHDSQPGTRFILLTGYGNEDVEKKARTLGAYEYLNKPISPEALSAIITAATVLEKKESESVVVAEAATDVLPELLQKVPLAETILAASKRRRFTTLAQAVGGLILAPILGLIFVMFLPVIGFATLFRVMLQAIRKRSAAPSL